MRASFNCEGAKIHVVSFHNIFISLALQSLDKQTEFRLVKLRVPVQAQGNIEDWLLALEAHRTRISDWQFLATQPLATQSRLRCSARCDENATFAPGSVDRQGFVAAQLGQFFKIMRSHLQTILLAPTKLVKSKVPMN